MPCSDWRRSTAPDNWIRGWSRKVAPLAREQVIAHAIDMDMLDTSGMQKILEWDRLEAANQLLLMAELQAAGETGMVDVDRLTTLANDNDLIVSAIAALLLAERDASARAAVDARLATASPSERLSVLRRMIEIIRIYELDAATPWLARMLENESSEDLTYWGTYTLMTIDPDRARPHWNRMLGSDPSYRNRIMGALQFLESNLAPDGRPGQTSTPRTIRSSRRSSTRPSCMRRRAHHRTGQGTDRHGASRVIDWAMRTARDLPLDQA